MAALCVHNLRIEVRSNPKFVPTESSRPTWFNMAVNFAETQYGSLRVLQLGDKTFQAAARVLKGLGASMAPAAEYCEKTARGLGAGWTVLCVPHSLKMWQSGTRAIEELSWDDAGYEADRERVQGVHDVAEAVSNFGHVGKFFTRFNLFGHVADASGLVSDVCDLKMNVEDISTMNSLPEVQDSELRAALTHKMQHSAMKAAKAVLSVLTGIAAAMAICSMTALFTPGFLLTCGLASASLAVTAHFYKERIDTSTRLGIIDFFPSPQQD